MRITIGVHVAVCLAACDSGGPLRVYNNPYADVDWDRDVRLRAQHHDHTGIQLDTLRAYDEAGYDVVSLMDYSGNRKLPYAWRERIWPPERVLPPSTLGELRNIKLFLPNAEEVGIRAHITSPFLTTYIEGVEEDPDADTPLVRASYQYSSLEEAFAVIRSEGGFPCIAHPWTVWYAPFNGSFCVEIYTAFDPASRHRGVSWFADRDPESLVKNWDHALQENQNIWGIAVNDHFGPQRRLGELPADIVDSGKIIVLARGPSLDAYRQAFVKGAFFAVQDRGTVKDRYPQIDSIIVNDERLSIETWGTVTWTANGATILEGPTLLLSDVPQGSRYVRAEVRGQDESVVYTQPFSIRPVGDVNGDYFVDSLDVALCLMARTNEEDVTHLLPHCDAAQQ